MAISNEILQKFIMAEGNLQKAQEMSLDEFLSSKASLGLGDATDEEATSVKKVIDMAVEKQGVISEDELEMAAGGQSISAGQVTMLVGGSLALLAMGTGAGILGKSLWDKHKNKKSQASNGSTEDKK